MHPGIIVGGDGCLVQSGGGKAGGGGTELQLDDGVSASRGIDKSNVLRIGDDGSTAGNTSAAQGIRSALPPSEYASEAGAAFRSATIARSD